MRNFFEKTKNIIVLGLFFLLGAYVTLWLLLNINPLATFFGKYVLTQPSETLTLAQKQALETLASGSLVVSADSIFSHLSDFYTLLVAFLAALLALSVVVGALYIFATNRKAIEDESERFMKTFTESKVFYDKICGMVNTTIDECLQDSDMSIDNFNERWNELDEKILQRENDIIFLKEKTSILENEIESVKSQDDNEPIEPGEQ